MIPHTDQHNISISPKVRGSLLSPIIAMALKDLRHLVRDRGAAFFTLVFPLLVALFFGFIFGGGGQRAGMNISVVDEDASPESARFVADLRADKAMVIHDATSRDQALEKVRKGSAVAAIVVPRGFGQTSKTIFSGGSFRIEGFVDPSKSAEAGLLTGKLNEMAFRQIGAVLGDARALDETLQNARSAVLEDKDITFANKALFGAMFEAINRVVASGGVTPSSLPASPPASPPAAPVASPEHNISQSPDVSSSNVSTPGGAGGGLGAWRPIDVKFTELTSARMTPRSGYEVSFTQGIIWGLMGCVTSFGSSLAAERSRGTLTRLSLAPISRGQILAGKALACFLACIGVQIALLIFGVLVFGIRIGSYPMLALALLASSLGFTGVMMFMAGLSRTEGSGAGMGRALVLVLAMIGGGTVPLFVLPQFMQTVSKVSPFSWASIAIEGATWRGFGLTDMLLPSLVMLAFGIVGFFIGKACLRFGE